MNTKIISNEKIADELTEVMVKDLLAHWSRRKKPYLTARVGRATLKRLGLGAEEINAFVDWLETPEGTQYTRRALGLKLFNAGFRPKGWQE